MSETSSLSLSGKLRTNNTRERDFLEKMRELGGNIEKWIIYSPRKLQTKSKLEQISFFQKVYYYGMDGVYNKNGQFTDKA